MAFSRKVLTLVITLAVFAACSDSGPPDVPAATGNWSGTVSGGTLSVLLTEAAGGAITGSGTISGNTSVALEANGVHVFPNVSITFTADGFEGMNFSGLMDSDGGVMSGTLNGSGFNDAAINLRRQ